MELTKIFSLEITVLGTAPPTIRRVDVPGTLTLLDLHRVVQTVFLWGNTGQFMISAAGQTWDTVDLDTNNNSQKVCETEQTERTIERIFTDFPDAGPMTYRYAGRKAVIEVTGERMEPSKPLILKLTGAIGGNPCDSENGSAAPDQVFGPDTTDPEIDEIVASISAVRARIQMNAG